MSQNRRMSSPHRQPASPARIAARIAVVTTTISDKSGKMGHRGTPPSDVFTTADACAYERGCWRLP